MSRIIKPSSLVVQFGGRSVLDWNRLHTDGTSLAVRPTLGSVWPRERLRCESPLI